jgi:NhaP-type Na+/H+ or K+/H+ antiporter
LADLLARTAIAAAAAVVANVLLRAIAKPLFDIPDDFEHIALRAVIVSTLVGVLAAALAYAVIRRTAKNPDRTFTIVAAIALVISLAAPLSLDGEAPAIGALVAMHVTTAAIVVGTFTRGARSAGSRR